MPALKQSRKCCSNAELDDRKEQTKESISVSHTLLSRHTRLCVTYSVDVRLHQGPETSEGGGYDMRIKLRKLG